MKKIISLVLVICCLFFTACSNSDGVIGGSDGPTSVIVGEKDQWGIRMYAQDVTPTGLTLKIEQSGGNPTGSLEYGAAYTLEMMGENDWQEVKTKTGDPLVWNLVAYPVKMNDVTEIKIDWQYAYGELDSGSYRLKKEIADFRAAGDFDQKIYEVYFSIK